MRTSVPPVRKMVILAALLAMLAAACGEDSAVETTAAADDAPATTAAATSATTAPADTASATTAAAETPSETTEAPATTMADDSGVEAVTTTAPAAQAPPGTVVRVAIAQDESTLTPFTHVSAPPFLDLVWDSLLIADSKNQLRPLVASSLDISADGMTFTMTIREGMTFHDGEPLTMDDILFTFEYQAKHGFLPGMHEVIESVESVDDTTLVVQLSQTTADFERDMLASLDIIPEHIFADVADPMTAGIEVAIGSGPYRISEYVEGESYVLTAHPNYLLGTPKVETIVMPIIPQPSAAFAALQTGEVDMVSAPVEIQLVEQFEGTEGIGLIRGSSFSPKLIIFNAERPPFDQVEVRRAISQAIDTDELMEFVALGVATPPNAGFLHPESPLATTPIPHIYDPAAAAAALDALGATPGDDGIRTINGQRMSYVLLVEAIFPDSVRVGELVKEMLAEVGIEIMVEPLEPMTLYSAVWPGFDVRNGRDFEMSMFSWQPILATRAGRFGGLVHSDTSRGTLNIGGFSDAGTDAAVGVLDNALTTEDKLAAIQGITEKIAELVPFITLYYPDTVFAYRPAAFDSWVYKEGQGPVDPVSFIDYNEF